MELVFMTSTIYSLSQPLGKIVLAALLTICLMATKNNELPILGDEIFLLNEANKSLETIDLSCSITAIEATNFSGINDKGTPECEDDTFTADVTVSFNNPPATGTLKLSGDATASVNVSQLSGGTHTFQVTMSADGWYTQPTQGILLLHIWGFSNHGSQTPAVRMD
jgi:hypothetical protein